MSIEQVSLLTDNGNTKDDLKLPTDENLLTQVYTYFSLIIIILILFFHKHYNFLAFFVKKFTDQGWVCRGEGLGCQCYVSNGRGADQRPQGYWSQVVSIWDCVSILMNYMMIIV